MKHLRPCFTTFPNISKIVEYTLLLASYFELSSPCRRLPSRLLVDNLLLLRIAIGWLKWRQSLWLDFSASCALDLIAQLIYTLTLLPVHLTHEYFRISLDSVHSFPILATSWTYLSLQRRSWTDFQFPGLENAVTSWLVRSTLERAIRARALARDIVLCSWARHFTLTVLLFTRVYKWVLADLMLGVTLRWTSIPSRGE